MDVSCASISLNQKKNMKKCLCLLFLLHMEKIFLFYKFVFIKENVLIVFGFELG